MSTPEAPTTTRICTQCGKEKPLVEFYRSRQGTYGYQSACKDCVVAKHKVWLATPDGKAKYKEYTRRHREKEGYKAKHRAYRDTPKAKWKAYTKDALRRGLVFDFTLDEFIARFWQKSCCYCGDAISTVGVDRLDYLKGYTIPNTVPCCYTCNIMKLKLSQGAFICKCRQIAKHWEGASAFRETAVPASDDLD